MAEVRKLTQADIDRILFQQSLGNRTPDQIIADNLAKGTGIQKLDPNFAQTAAAGARKVAQTVDKFGGVRNYLPFPIAGLLPPEVDAKVSDLMGISGTARFYDALGAGKAPSLLDTVDAVGVGSTAVQGAKLGAKGVVAAGKAAAPVVGNMAEQYAVKTGLLNPMIAWHGSPYSFDKFDLAHVGKGEGAQAYGHGMYFAQAPEVADGYRVGLSYDPEKMKIGGKQINKVYDAIQNNAARMPAVQARPEYEKLELLERLMSNDALTDVQNAAAQMSPATQTWFNKSVMPSFETYGSLYKVDIPDPAVATFLDWDKPLSQQSAQIQEFARNVPIPYAKGKTAGVIKAWREGRDVGLEATGRDLLNAVSDYGVQAPEGSAVLSKGGIQGIRYLDGGSRGTGAGTSNFVVFDPSIVKILERNGQPMGLLETPKK